MIDRDQMHVHQFGKLAVALYKGRLLAVGLDTGPHDEDVTVLFPCDTVERRGNIICRNKELHSLCVSR